MPPLSIFQELRLQESGGGPHDVHAVKVQDIVGLVLLVCLLDLGQDLCIVANSARRRDQSGGVDEAHTDAVDGAVQQLHLGSHLTFALIQFHCQSHLYVKAILGSVKQAGREEGRRERTFLVPSAKLEGAGRPSRLWMVAVLPVPAMPMQRMVAVKGSSSGGPCCCSWRSASAMAASKGLRLGPPLFGTRMLSARSSLCAIHGSAFHAGNLLKDNGEFQQLPWLTASPRLHVYVPCSKVSAWCKGSLPYLYTTCCTMLERGFSPRRRAMRSSST